MKTDFQPSKYTIGLVWESADVAEVVKEVLEAKGYRIIKYGSSKNALHKMGEKLPDLVFLCNIMLCEIDGWTLIKKIREKWDNNQVEIIVASVKGNVDYNAELEVGGYISKPFDLEDLFSLVKNVLRKRDERRANS